jgi:hypothetical protein
MMIEIPLGADVKCTDDFCGRSTYVILNPITQKVTYFVVKERKSPHSERLVPINLVAETTPKLIALNCSKEDFNKRDTFVSTRLVEMDRPYFVGGPGGNTRIYHKIKKVPVEYQQIPPGELAVGRNTHVEGMDVDVGVVTEFIIEGETGNIVSLNVRKGHLLQKNQITIPISLIDKFGGTTVHLKPDRESAE